MNSYDREKKNPGLKSISILFIKVSTIAVIIQSFIDHNRPLWLNLIWAVLIFTSIFKKN